MMWSVRRRLTDAGPRSDGPMEAIWNATYSTPSQMAFHRALCGEANGESGSLACCVRESQRQKSPLSLSTVASACSVRMMNFRMSVAIASVVKDYAADVMERVLSSRAIRASKAMGTLPLEKGGKTEILWAIEMAR